MPLVQLDERHRITLPKDVRKRFKIVDGQKFYLVPFGNDLLMKPVPNDPAGDMSKIVGSFQFKRKDRKKAEQWLLKTTSHRKKSY
jgi:bifunctional DNA-binding transcriptional regulator/antitoxin component of YhaV-PrlF toxin-antitoxin module